MASERPWLESLAACVPDALVLVRADGSILWSNREFCRLVGCEGTAKGAPLARWLPDWPAVAGDLRPERQTRPLACACADGHAFELAATIAPCAPGLDAAWALHLRPADEADDLRRQLHARERSYSFLRENTSDLILRTDAALSVIWANHSDRAPFVAGAKLIGLLAPASAESLQRIAAGPAPGPHEADIESAPGLTPKFAMKAAVRRLSDDAGAFVGLSLILRDTTESRAIERFVAEHQLSPREQEILGYLVQGYSNLNIATILGLSESGVKFHIRNVFARAKVASRTELMAQLMEG